MTKTSARMLGLLGVGALVVLMAIAYPHIVAEASARTAVFTLTPAPRAISEEALLPLAAERLRSSDLRVEDWSPRASENATAPDHFPHRRGVQNGAFYFTNAAGRTRIISIDLKDGQIRAAARILQCLAEMGHGIGTLVSSIRYARRKP